MTRWRVMISCLQLQQTIDRYRGLFAERATEIVLPPMAQHLGEAELLPIIDGFDGVIAGDDRFTAAVIRKGAPRLKVIAKWGVGIDAIDLDAAKQAGIPVYNTPDVFADEVADVVLGYLVLLARRLHELDRAVRQGSWTKIRGVSLRGRTLGVVGAGSIGRAVLRRGIALGMQVAAHDVVPVPEAFVAETGLRVLSLPELLAASDVVSLNCNLTAANRHMLGPRELAAMKPGAFLINTARGGLIDEAALIRALQTGPLAGAALDVFEQEPLPADSPLRALPNVIFGTHNGSNTEEAVLRVNEMAIRNLFRGLEGASA